MSDNTFYEPLTPVLRAEIISSIDKNISELKTCSDNAFVNMEIAVNEHYKDTLNKLPDGYPVPMNWRF